MYNINQEFSAIKLQFYLTAHSIDNLTRMYTYLYEGGDPRQVDYLYDTTLYFGGRIAGMEDFVQMVWSKIKNACRWVINLVIRAINRILSFIGVEPIKELKDDDYENELATKKDVLNKVAEGMTGNKSSTLAGINSHKNNAMAAVYLLSQRLKDLGDSISFLVKNQQGIPSNNNATGLDAVVKQIVDGSKLAEIPDLKSLRDQFLDTNEPVKPFDDRKIKLVKLTSFTQLSDLYACMMNECLPNLKKGISIIISKYDYLMDCANRAKGIEQSLNDNGSHDPDKAKQLGDDAQKEIAKVTAEMTTINVEIDRTSNGTKYLQTLVNKLNVWTGSLVTQIKNNTTNQSQSSGTTNSSQQGTTTIAGMTLPTDENGVAIF